MSRERSGRAAKYGKLEEALMLWFNDIRLRGAPVTDAMLVDKAQNTIPLPYLENRQTFYKNKVRMYKYYLKKSCNYIFEIKKSCNYIFEIIKLYLYHIYVVILFAQPIHVLI